MTIVGDTTRRPSGHESGLSSQCGHLVGHRTAVGGIFSQLGISHSVFLINIPLCFLAASMFSRHFHEKVTHRHRTVNVLGAALLACAMTALILAILGGGQTWAWYSAPSISAVAAGAALLVAFVFVERRAAEPVLPLWVFSRRLLCATTIVAFGVGAILMGLTSYVPTFLEGSLRIQPVIAGLALAALTLGWPATASVAGRFYLRWGFKNTAILGAALVIAGSAVLAAAAHPPNVAVVAAVCLVIGGGMGLLAVPTLIAAQSSVDWNERASSPATICSPARSVAPWASPSSVRSPTRSSDPATCIRSVRPPSSRVRPRCSPVCSSSRWPLPLRYWPCRHTLAQRRELIHALCSNLQQRTNVQRDSTIDPNKIQAKALRSDLDPFRWSCRESNPFRGAGL